MKRWKTGGEFKEGHIPWNKGIKRMDIAKEKHPLWKGGVSSTKEWRRERNRVYWEKHKELFRLKAKARKAKLRTIGIITRQTIQAVYEDNIKKYGTLTCYLCLNPIQFGNDHLEHKIPISKGGTNAYVNLGVACSQCNLRKGDKTVEEFLKIKEVA